MTRNFIPDFNAFYFFLNSEFTSGGTLKPKVLLSIVVRNILHHFAQQG